MTKNKIIENLRVENANLYNTLNNISDNYEILREQYDELEKENIELIKELNNFKVTLRTVIKEGSF